MSNGTTSSVFFGKKYMSCVLHCKFKFSQWAFLSCWAVDHMAMPFSTTPSLQLMHPPMQSHRRQPQNCPRGSGRLRKQLVCFPHLSRWSPIGQEESRFFVGWSWSLVFSSEYLPLPQSWRRHRSRAVGRRPAQPSRSPSKLSLWIPLGEATLIFRLKWSTSLNEWIYY